MLALTRVSPDVDVTWVVLAREGERALEAASAAEAFLADAGSSDVRIHEFRDGFLPYVGAEVKEVFEGLKGVEPDLVFTHHAHRLHQDHRLACELTWNTFRDHLVLEYEIPKYDGDLGSPNVFVPLDRGAGRREAPADRAALSEPGGEALVRRRALLLARLRLRGMEAATRYAEAFTCRKLTLAVG